jgi:hypothetical protein
MAQILNRFLHSSDEMPFSLWDELDGYSSLSAAFTRYQISANNLKARLVFCVSYILNVIET